MGNKKIYVEDLVKILFSQTRISIENEWYKTLYDDKILTQQKKVNKRLMKYFDREVDSFYALGNDRIVIRVKGE